jgi:MFS transporter, OFA family, oxalate/formate antiporter
MGDTSLPISFSIQSARAERSIMDSQGVRNLGWRVTLAGIGINLALGVLYAWSVVKKEIPANWDGFEWTDLKKNLPYAVACLVFALTMVPAGRAQDRFGPRWVALAGGIAVGLGMILASFFTSCTGFVIGFGILAGAGIGMGYAAATPAAVKWFPPQRTGMIAGLVVAGFGLASVYISPLATYLIKLYAVADKDGVKFTGPGVQKTMLILGIAFMIAVGLLSQVLRVPPAQWKPAISGAAAKKPMAVDYSWQKMLATPQFFIMWFMYLFAAGAGLMIIANLAAIVKLQAKSDAGFLFVALLAIGNAAGRVAAGTLSDVIGRRATMMIVFVFQAVLMFVLHGVGQLWVFAVISIFLGANYGANLALFPAATKDYFGLKNFGVNYGWVFTAWGVGAAVLALVSGKIKDVTGNYDLAYLIAGVGLIAAAILLLLLKPIIASAQGPLGDTISQQEQPAATGNK